MGADDVHPESAERGAVLVSVSLYPVTPIVSVAVNDEMETVRDDEVDGMVKEVMEGGVVSETAFDVYVRELGFVSPPLFVGVRVIDPATLGVMVNV